MAGRMGGKQVTVQNLQVPLEIMADGIALMGETEVKQVLGTELLNII
jgi:ribosomal protein L3